MSKLGKAVIRAIKEANKKGLMPLEVTPNVALNVGAQNFEFLRYLSDYFFIYFPRFIFDVVKNKSGKI